jgi:nitrile hydratase
MPPAAYLTTPYYVHWMHAFEEYLTAGDADFAAELDRRTAGYLQQPDLLLPVYPGEGTALADELELFYRQGEGASRPATSPPRYTVGDRVRVSPSVTPHHTRKPGYTRGIVGEVTACWGTYAFPDTNVLGQGESPQHMVTVRFSAVDLYGEEFGDPTVDVYVDLWEPYLHPAVEPAAQHTEA